MKKIMKTFAMILASMLLMVTFTANAWIYTPTNQIDIDLVTYWTAKYKNATNSVSLEFYNEVEHFGYALVADDMNGVKPKIWVFSNKTNIGYSYWTSTLQLKYKLMCPDGHSATVVRHIALAKGIFTPNVYLPRADGQVCGYVAPANKTSIATIQGLYPGLTITRLYSNRDIFKAECVNITGCSTLNPNSDFRGLTYYLSNTKRIGYHFSNITAGDQYRYPYVRTTEGAPDQTTADDINLLVNNYLSGQYIYWVNSSSSYQYIQWFNY